MGLVMPPDSVEEYVCQVSTPYLNLDPCYRLHGRHPTGAREGKNITHKVITIFSSSLAFEKLQREKVRRA